MLDLQSGRHGALDCPQNSGIYAKCKQTGHSYPIKDAWMADYHAQAAKNLRLTSVAVTTDSDRKTLPLLHSGARFAIP